MTEKYEVCDDALNYITEVEIHVSTILGGTPPSRIIVDGKAALYSPEHGVYIIYG